MTCRVTAIVRASNLNRIRAIIMESTARGGVWRRSDSTEAAA